MISNNFCTMKIHYYNSVIRCTCFKWFYFMTCKMYRITIFKNKNGYFIFKYIKLQMSKYQLGSGN